MRHFYLLLLLLCATSGCKPALQLSGSSLVLMAEQDMQLQLTPAEAPVETPLQLQLIAKDVVAISGELTGISMYMGRIPLRFTQHNELWQAEFLLGACSEPAMLWQVELELSFANGEKHKVKQQFHSSWQ